MKKGRGGMAKATIPREAGRRKKTFGKNLHAMAQHTTTDKHRDIKNLNLNLNQLIGTNKSAKLCNSL